MTQTEIDQINEMMAEAMGLSQWYGGIEGLKNTGYASWNDADGNYSMGFKDWNPWDNVEQALMVADTLTHWTLEKITMRSKKVVYTAMVIPSRGKEGSCIDGKKLSQAICLAVKAWRER